MLIWFVVLYLLVSIGIGLFAATRVHSAKDFAVAGRHLPLPVVTATVFATWFGAEAVFGVSATFVKEGLRGVVADPFGSSMCLIIAGIFFSRKLYKLNILTLGDYFRMRYNRSVEVLTTLCIVASYLGWVSAQIKALGLVFNVVTNEGISQTAGMILGAAIVLTYTTLAACSRWRSSTLSRWASSWAACCSSPGSLPARPAAWKPSSSTHPLPANSISSQPPTHGNG
jgi:Na+/proline symporter